VKIFVFIKQVPDTAIALKIKADATDIIYQDIPWVINPYDEYAVEEALRIKEKLGGSVTVISMGPDRAADIIRSSFAMGADEAVHLKDTAFNSLDAYSTVFILSKAISISEYDIILCGKQAVDDGWGYIGPALAEILNISAVSSILKLKISEDKKYATATREIDDGLEIVEVPLPALFTVQQGINKPRYASLPGIMKAKKKEIKVVDAAALGLASVATDLQVCGASRTNVKKLFYPPERKKGRILEGDSVTVIKDLVNLLRDEANVI
jgi:electron transfer flavoprotein beta subunit